SLIARGEEEAALLLLDGHNCQGTGFPKGNWAGPTLVSRVSTDREIYRAEIFCPVLSCVAVDSRDAVNELIHANPYCHGTTLLTSSVGAARKFQHEIEVGQVGINIPIPVPLPFFSFTGWKGSFYGDQHAYGKQAVRFYTETKTVTSRWFSAEPVSGPNFSINLK